MKILVCGSRTFTNRRLVYGLLRAHTDVMSWSGRTGTLIIHGAAKGADSIASTWAAINEVPQRAFPADWAKHGKRAGYLRNAEMLAEGKPDLVLAFVDKPLAESRGTAMMVELARKAGVPTVVVEARP